MWKMIKQLQFAAKKGQFSEDQDRKLCHHFCTQHPKYCIFPRKIIEKKIMKSTDLGTVYIYSSGLCC